MRDPMRDPIEVKTSDEVMSKLNSMEVDPYKFRVFLALQTNPQIYKGTVPHAEKIRRRAANKRQRMARKASRHAN